METIEKELNLVSSKKEIKSVKTENFNVFKDL